MKDTVKDYLDKKKRRASRQKKVVATLLSLSLVVATGVTWSLHQTGESLAGETYCGKVEHTHTDACLKKETEQIDTKAAETEKVLTCTLPEHKHTDACITKTLICGMEEGQGAHTHTADCYQEQKTLTCTQAEHVHGEGCYDADGNLICEIPEHTHGEECYTTEQVLVCGQEESAGHVHTDACYEITYTCGMEEHTHTDACYSTVEVTEGATEAATEAAEVTKAPEYTCGLEEHKHTLQCYSNPNADLETASVWEQTIAGVQLTGDYGKDVVAIAKTQLGYHESTANYNVVKADDGTEKMKGYTRYGAWYGSPYEDWCAMFASFCISYAHVDYPLEAYCPSWIDTLAASGRYSTRDAWTPAIGDLVFFDQNGDGTSDHVGIVEALTLNGSELGEDADLTTADGIKTIEGNTSDQVAERSYSRSDGTIMGYGVLPVKLEEDTTTTKTAQFEGYTVTVSYDKNANIPDDAELVVTRAEEPTDLTELAKTLTEATGTKIEAEGSETLSANTISEEGTSDASAEAMTEANLTADSAEASGASDAAASEIEKPEKTVASVDCLDISFMQNGTKIEPAEGSTVNVQITITGGVELGEDSELGIVHYKEDGTIEVVGGLTQNSDDAQNTVLGFETNSFSPYRIVRLAAYSDALVTVTSVNSVSIEDKVKTDGIFELKVNVTLSDETTAEYSGEEAAKILADSGYQIAWTKSGDSTPIAYEQITLDNGSTAYKREENGGWVNVAYTGGAEKTYTVTITKDGRTVGTATSPIVSYNAALQNPSFETNDGNYGTDGNAASNVPDWNTTAGSQTIEIINSNTSGYYLNIKDDGSAVDGSNYAEINAKEAAALYQDVLTVPGQTMYWKYSHRARTQTYSSSANYGRGGFVDISDGASKSDTMAMIIAPLELVEDITTQSQLEDFYSKLSNKNGANQITKTLEDETVKTYTVYVYEDTATMESKQSGWSSYLSSSWNNRSGSITVPEGQYTSRFFFMAVSTATGDKSVGNLVDDVWFSQELPSGVTAGSATINVVKRIYGVDVNTVNTALANKSFIAADGSDITFSNWQDGTDSSGSGYVEATATYTREKVFGSVSMTVEEITDSAKIEGYNLTDTTVAVGSEEASPGTNKSITVAKGETETVTFSNTYAKATVDVTIAKVVTENEKDNTEFPFTVSSDKQFTSYSVNRGSAETPTQNEQGGYGFVDKSIKTGQTIVLKDVPIGAKLTISEGNAINYTTTAEVSPEKGTLSDVTDGTSNIVSTKSLTYTVGDEATTVTVKNSYNPTPADLTIWKISDDGNTALSGAEFTLKNDDTGKYYSSNGKCDSDSEVKILVSSKEGEIGKLEFLGLTGGSYTLTETKAPDGYQLMTDTITFTVSDGAIKDVQKGKTSLEPTGGEERNSTSGRYTYSLKVTNSTGTELPMTGGPGTTMLTLSGLLLMTASLVYGCGLRRRRERRAK